MSESRSLLIETAGRFFRETQQDADLSLIVAQTEELGFSGLLVSPDAGGFGGDWLDAVAVMRLAGFHAFPAPLAEAIIGHHAASVAGMPLGDGLVSIAGDHEGALNRGRFTGRMKAVSWGRVAEFILASRENTLLVVKRSDAKEILERQSPAGDPRDTLVFDDAPAQVAQSSIDLFKLGALSRTALIAGALDAALQCSIEYANQRVQFGKAIGKFQAVQQNLALMAEDAAAVNCAAEAAARAVMRGAADFEIAAAKLRANMAAGTGAAIAHQVHGAIGFTREYALHRWTRRLVSWASEFGSERSCARTLGEAVVSRGADVFWHDLTRRSDLTSKFG